MNALLACFSRRPAHHALAAAVLSLGPLALAQTTPVPPTPAAASADRPAPTSSQGLTVTLNGRSTQLSPAQLAAMPQTTITTHNAHTNTDDRYTGVALADLFTRLGLPQQHGPQQAQLLHSYLRAQGTDNYFVLFSAVEVDRELHKGNVIVALQRNGQPLAREGQLMLVSTEDAMPMRSVRNLTSLTLSTVN